MIDPVTNLQLTPPPTVRHGMDLITEEELAVAIDVKVNTLQVWRSHGEGPDFVKLGKTVFYRMSDLRIWVQKNCHKPEPSRGRSTP
jgi:hypothetical protein